jgi:alkaline phosphatase
MIEGSRIDMAGHTNDPATHVHEILAYQRTVEVVKKFVDENPSTVMISVSDHETGGLSVAHQLGPAYPEYKW